MTKPTTAEILKYYTMRDLVINLGLTRQQIKTRLKKGTLPEPTRINKHGTRLFDAEWIEAAKHIVMCERGQLSPFDLAARLSELGVQLDTDGN